MPYYATSQEWLRVSAQLIEARPTTRRHPESSASGPPRASLTIKTFDPISGACLKYRTTKAAEVSRLILSLGQLGRKMAALPDEAAADTTMVDAVEAADEEKGKEVQAQVPAQTQTQTQTQGQQQGGGGGGGKGKKKRGKK
ncbi:signal recognition particle 9 kDa protein-domain-containing protein [Poronia punctata]|nr:signal recognition particle 9 kDa protein-domain-containing protein [Poronia punctata]